jgi:putative acetyltransferase
MTITEGGLGEPDVVALLGEHLQGMADHSPPESIHTLTAGRPGRQAWRAMSSNQVNASSKDST